MAFRGQSLSLIDRTVAYIQDHRIILPDQRYILSFSGGPDSVFLLEIMKRFCSPDQLFLVYFDHQLRTESAYEIQFVRDIGMRDHIEILVYSLDVFQESRRLRESIETTGRHMRRLRLMDIARDRQIRNVLTAHQLDDQCETFLYKLIRGSKTFLGGISGNILFSDDVSFVRPLLQVTKLEILDYLDTHGIEYCLDHTNELNMYTRNKIRNQILPLIEQINPGYRHIFASQFQYFQELNAYLDSVCAPIFAHCSIQGQDISIDAAFLKQYPGFIQKRIIFLMAIYFQSHQYNITDFHIQKIFDYLSSNRSTSLSLPDKIHCYINQRSIVFRKYFS